MAIIHLEGMEFYAYHGHYKEEQQVGNKFLIDIQLTTCIKKASETDNLNDALDYSKVYELIATEMKNTSQLLENITIRIVRTLFTAFSQVEHIALKVSKLNPPLGGRVEKVSVEWSGNREMFFQKM